MNYKVTCAECGKTVQARSKRKLCGPECRLVRLERRRKKVTLPCTWCGASVLLTGRNGLSLASRGRAYCCAEHKTLELARISSITMARTNRKYASARMIARNPMRRPEVRAQVSKTLVAMGWGPIQRGGNGRPPTKAELLISAALGWQTNVIVPTRVPRGNGYPTHYKIDVGDPDLKIAIECDGLSHNSLSRRAQDRKKEAFLRELGWTVLRFSNQAATDRLADCVRKVRSTILTLKARTPTSQTGS